MDFLNRLHRPCHIYIPCSKLFLNCRDDELAETHTAGDVMSVIVYLI